MTVTVCFSEKASITLPYAMLARTLTPYCLLLPQPLTAMRLDKSQSLEFINLARDIAPPGVLVHSTSYPFEFARVEKRFESYTGTNVLVR